MISKKTKYILIALTIVGIMITGTAYAVNFASEYDTNNPVSQDNEWNQYKWQAEGADVLQNGAVVTWPPNQLYDANHAVLMPPGSTVQYYLYLPGVQNSTIDVKWGIYRLFLFADTTNNDTQSSVNIHVYIDYDFIQIVKRITSPAAPGHCGVIDVGWIDFQDEPPTIGQNPPPQPCHVIEIANLDQQNQLIIDEIVISTAN